MEKKRCISRTRFTERRLDVSSMETLHARAVAEYLRDQEREGWAMCYQD
jgi:hypothetical protein